MSRSDLCAHTRYQKAAFEGDPNAATLMLREAQRRNAPVQTQAAESLLELIKILDHRPDSGAWNRLCASLQSCTETYPENLNTLLSWITPVVVSCPSVLRVAPLSWCDEDFLSSSSPPTPNTPSSEQTPQQKLRGLTRALSIMGPVATQPNAKDAPPKIELLFSDQEVEVDLLQKYQHSLRRLLLHHPSKETLSASPNIERLTLIGADISIWKNPHIFFPNLKNLCLIKVKNETLDLKIIARCAPNLRCLSIRSSSIENLLNLNALIHLEQFSLCGKFRPSEALIAHPKLRQITLQTNQERWDTSWGYHSSPQPPFNVQIGPLPELRSMVLHLPIKNTRWLKNCPKLRHLDLNCEAKKLENIKHCPDLQRLILKGKFQRLRFYLRKKEIPRCPLHPQLKHIDVRGCHDLVSLIGVRHLPQLKILHFNECERLKNLSFLSKAPQIQYESLDLSQMTGLNSLEGLEGQIHLQKITLPGDVYHQLKRDSGLAWLKMIPQLTHLEIFNTGSCYYQSFVIPMLPKLIKLRILSDAINSLKGLEKLPSLQLLNLKRCREIRDWSHLKDEGENLLILDVRGCYRNHFADTSGLGFAAQTAKYYPPKSWFRRYEGQEEVHAALAQLKRPL